ncbi:SpoIIE family protein phosphatase/ATP-binding protein [Streptomyces sp. BK340]|uniref:SpoIIE family protein phosphatase/ATP-binding protein n=1 Tax=Streptomyces sp. BK340 TaxID=2572903 RepID=UPI0011AA6662|nr:SpoIIE family protein phosphatase/ATP-binding protein [Streptomyces sp. BK340]
MEISGRSDEPERPDETPGQETEQSGSVPRRSLGRHLRSLVSARSVAGQVFLFQLALVVLLVAVTVVTLLLQDRRLTTESAADRSLAVAQAFANSPGIAAAMKSSDPSAVLQPRTEAARKLAHVDYIVALSPYGFRWTHPDPSMIGQHVTTGYGQALTGVPVQKTFDSSLGRAVDSTVAVFDTKGSPVGLITVGVTVNRVSSAAQHQLPILIAVAGAALLLAAGGATFVSSRLRRQTRGLAPAEMTRMYEHHDAVLHAVREGVLIVGDDRRLLLANDEARRLLDLPPEAERHHVTELGLAPDIADLLVSGRTANDEVCLAGDRLLAVNLRPVDPKEGPPGTVATLRDTTELSELTGKAEEARQRLQLNYEAALRIGTTLDVVLTAEELAEVAVPMFADFATVELLDPVLHGGEPTEASTEVRRVAAVGIREDPPFYPVGRLIRLVPTSPVATSVTTQRAVLEADLAASDGWRAQDPERTQRVIDYGIHSLISVPLHARGVLLGVADFWRSDREPFEEDDLPCAEELAARAAVCIDNARRYTREHTTAVTLQRSLLPGLLPEHSALDVGHRYLPARAGVGGDWFDVIPLPGARVALVVGDVVGHGLHAAVTMGRLRTAVHNFSALDLPPDELLVHLDELAERIDQEAAAEGKNAGITGATCLYAVYDPVSGRCCLARAGHPGPALVGPDGKVTFPDVPVAPPLGIGSGLPVEMTELHLPEGSQLVLYTDGLVEERGRDIDSGLEMLRDALAKSDGSPEGTCQTVLDAMLSARPSDDVALLVARTRLLAPDQVADWDVPNDIAAVSRIRAEVTSQLEAWGLHQAVYTTELIISELVTNAIRYGIDPIRTRVLRDGNTLICEVSDGSSTSPHMRRAATTDEGGRGLFLVAQFSQRWGTRYLDRGKIIWTEQVVGDEAAESATDADALLDLWTDSGL